MHATLSIENEWDVCSVSITAIRREKTLPVRLALNRARVVEQNDTKQGNLSEALPSANLRSMVAVTGLN